ncbi:hypothetical protein OIO90_002562 [Microbotryomycetes sp. JL221]|nr:hypothetical protein OIO90_002562 [Microbotryomycetes sp. JL221]
MSSLRKLMKDKSTAARLTHSLARYDTRGNLSCSVCHVQIKTAALFGPHLQSKAHRSNVQKQQQQQQRQASSLTAAGVHKRPRPDNDEHEPVDDDVTLNGNDNKRIRSQHQPSQSQHDDDDDDGDGEDDDAARATGSRSTALPDDFFADPTQAPTMLQQDDDEDDKDDRDDRTGTGNGAAADEDDPEWAEFEASLRQDGTSSIGPAVTQPSATISAAPVEYEFGAPKIEGVDDDAEQRDQEDDDVEPEETEEERLARLDREEKEEIMQRIEQEELEQKLADDKVVALKKKLELMKAQRKAKAKQT